MNVESGLPRNPFFQWFWLPKRPNGLSEVICLPNTWPAGGSTCTGRPGEQEVRWFRRVQSRVMLQRHLGHDTTGDMGPQEGYVEKDQSQA